MAAAARWRARQGCARMRPMRARATSARSGWQQRSARAPVRAAPAVAAQKWTFPPTDAAEKRTFLPADQGLKIPPEENPAVLFFWEIHFVSIRLSRS